MTGKVVDQTRKQNLLVCGMIMPCVYGLTLVTAWMINPGFDLLRREPSELGRLGAAHPWVYNLGMVATGITGLLGAAGLTAARSFGRNGIWDVCTGISTFVACIGVMMAGLFPLPSTLHYGFGLTTASVLTPLFGGLSMWMAFRPVAGVGLILGFAAIVTLIVAGAPPLAAAALMFASIAYLCRNACRRIGTSPNSGDRRVRD